MNSGLLKAVMIPRAEIYFCKCKYLRILEIYVSSLQLINFGDPKNVSFKG